MKKNLIVALALVFVLGIAGTAFAAANPFVDVPAKHWAYDAVTKLAQAGILDGYGDGTYRGERLATRYEMAQATAKAMARADKADAQMKGLIDKLAVEFAAELNNLGVRVAKLEKNASSIKFWGDSRMRYQSNDNGAVKGATAADVVDGNAIVARNRFNQRLRVYAKADLNDKATFYGRMMAEWTDRPEITATNADNGTGVYWDYGYFQWKFNPQFAVSVGRHQVIAGQDLFWTNGGYDGVQFYFGAPSDKFTAKLGYGDVGTYNGFGTGTPPQTAVMAKELLLADVNYKVNKDWGLNAAAYWGVNGDNANLFNTGAYTNGYPFHVFELGFRGNLSPDFNLRGSYFWNTAAKAKDYVDTSNNPNGNKDNPNGWMAELWYKGADKAKVGTWGLAANYRDIKPWAIDLGNVSGMMGNSMTNATTIAHGQKGWGFQANYTISKNAVMTMTYEKLSRNASHDSRDLEPFYYLQLNVNF